MRFDLSFPGMIIVGMSPTPLRSSIDRTEKLIEELPPAFKYPQQIDQNNREGRRARQYKNWNDPYFKQQPHYKKHLKNKT